MMMVRMVIVLRCRTAGYLGRPWECLIRHHGCDALRFAYVSFVVAGLLILIKYSEKEIVWHSCDENGIDCYINEIFLFSIMVFFGLTTWLVYLPTLPQERQCFRPLQGEQCAALLQIVWSQVAAIFCKNIVFHRIYQRAFANLQALVCKKLGVLYQQILWQCDRVITK